MLTLKELQEDEEDFHIPQPEAMRPHLQGERVLTWGRRVPASAFACQGSMP